MFCGNCGASNPEGSKVCGSCGASLPVGETGPENPTGQIPPEGGGADKRNKLIGLGVVLAAAVAAIALIFWVGSMLFGGNGPEDVATQFVRACLDPKGGKTVVSLLPREVVRKAMEEGDFDTRAELIEGLNDALAMSAEYLEEVYGKYKVKIKVREIDSWKRSEIRDYNESLDNQGYDMQIKDGAEVRLRVTIDGRDDTDSETQVVSVIKVGGKWYIDGMNIGLLAW